MKYLDLSGLQAFWHKINNIFQRKLVSGTNIKTISSQSLLGVGNIDVSNASKVNNYSFTVMTQTQYDTALANSSLPSNTWIAIVG